MQINNDIDLERDYQYFKDLWQSKASARNSNKAQEGGKKRLADRETSSPRKRQSCSSQQRNSAAPAKKKRRIDAVAAGKGPIENIDFVKDEGKDSSSFIDEENAMQLQSKPSRKHCHNNDNSKGEERAARYGDHLLYQHLSDKEMDNLVGWATSHRGNGGINSNRTSSKDVVDSDLSYIPKPPPPPSHIAFLHELINQRLKTANNNDEDTTNHHKGAKAESEELNRNINRGNIDVSTYVSTGMAIEDILTMKLMPLAKAHAGRCRRLERQKKKDGSQRANSATSDPFHAWTLPPAEAIVELAKDDDKTLSCKSALAALVRK